MGLPWISGFMSLFAAGTLLATTTIPVRVIGERFHRYTITTAMTFAILAALSAGVLSGLEGPRWLPTAYAGALFLYAVAIRIPKLRSSTWLNVALAAWGCLFVYGGLRDELSFGLLFAAPISAATLGMALVSMMLGHSYLSAGNLSFDLLIRTCRLLLGVLAIRGLSSAIFFWPESDILTAWMEEDVVLVLFVGVRYGVGIACGFALAWMALACAKIRSNQSATGILYVVLGFVVMGELVAAYLMGDRGVAI